MCAKIVPVDRMESALNGTHLEFRIVVDSHFDGHSLQWYFGAAKAGKDDKMQHAPFCCMPKLAILSKQSSDNNEIKNEQSAEDVIGMNVLT